MARSKEGLIKQVYRSLLSNGDEPNGNSESCVQLAERFQDSAADRHDENELKKQSIMCPLCMLVALQ